MKKTRVLLVGMARPQNQFRRAIESYGCEFEHDFGQPGTRFPTNCDAVVIATGFCSHQKMWDVKDAYKLLQRPVFLADLGFSHIRGDFEKFLGARGWIPNQRLRAQVDYIASQPDEPEEAAAPEPEPVKIIEPEVVEPQHRRRRLSHDEIQRRDKIILDCETAGMTTRETADMLKAEGFERPSGGPYTDKDVYYIKYQWRNTQGQPTALVHKEPAVPKPIPPPAPVVRPAPPIQLAPSAPAPKDDSLTLIDRVLRSKLEPARQIELIGKIRAGTLKGVIETGAQILDQGKTIRLYRHDILDPTKVCEVRMSREQADVVLSQLGPLHDFVSNFKT